jgi:NAD dependent epimerase/dehydratase family enzyme
VCDGQRVAPARLLESGFRFRYTTFEAAVSALLKSTLEEKSS